MSKNISLVGLMGSGKTTIGKLLAVKTGKELLDTDLIIEKEAHKKIAEIFELYGEALFRQLEIKTVETTCKLQNKIIATGGGCVENQENMQNLKTNSVMFYLRAKADELYDRIKHDDSRPLLKNANPLGTLKQLLKKREHFYDQADEVIDTTNKQANEIVDEILEKCKKYE
jgi:shikimate kinase